MKTCKTTLFQSKVEVLAIFLIVFISLAAETCAQAEDWFVQPSAATGTYGNEDGTDYDNAWNGLLNVVWGTNGVDAGDTLYVCGTHIYDMQQWEGDTYCDINVSGGDSEVLRVTISGSYDIPNEPDEPGIIWGAYKINYNTWVQELDESENPSGVWSINLTGQHQNDWFFKDADTASHVFLDKVDSKNDLINNSTATDSFYYEYPTLSVRTDGTDPTGHIYANSFGYVFKLANENYITFKDLEIYNMVFRGDYTGGNIYESDYITWENCKLTYGMKNALLSISDGNDYMKVIDCELSYARNGIYNQSNTNNAPKNYLYKGNYIHDIGTQTWLQVTNDNHGIGIQGGNHLVNEVGIIEDNIIERVGSGIALYVNMSQDIKNTIVRRNIVTDMRPNLTYATGYGISLMCDNDAPGTKSGNKVYQNIIIGNQVAPYDGKVGIFVAFDSKTDIYNNTIYNCDVGLFIGPVGNTIPENVYVRNNIILDCPTNVKRHSNLSGYTINIDDNIYWPASSNFVFYCQSGCEYNFTEWKSFGFDPNSTVANPHFKNASGAYLNADDFKLTAYSPAIDTGADMDLETDFVGNSIVGDHDIGAYEYQLAQLLIDYGAEATTTNKLYIYDGSGNPSEISNTGWDPENFTYWEDASLVLLDYGTAHGLYSYDGATFTLEDDDFDPTCFEPWVYESGSINMVAIAQNGGGFYTYDSSGLSSEIQYFDDPSYVSLTPENFQACDDYLAIDDSNGLYTYDGTDISLVNSSDSPDNMIYYTDEDLLMLDYGSSGNYTGLYTYDGSTLSQIGTWDPENFIYWPTQQLAMIDYGTHGLYKYDGTNFASFGSWDPEGLGIFGNDLILEYIDYGTANNGLHLHNGTVSTHITKWDAEVYVQIGSKLAVSFFNEDKGLAIYDGIKEEWTGHEWEWEPDDMIAVDWDF